jgi:hypothetical protein
VRRAAFVVLPQRSSDAVRSVGKTFGNEHFIVSETDAGPEMRGYLVVHVAEFGSLSRAVMKPLVVAFEKFLGVG